MLKASHNFPTKFSVFSLPATTFQGIQLSAKKRGQIPPEGDIHFPLENPPLGQFVVNSKHLLEGKVC